MTPYPYGTPPTWWGNRAAAGQAAKDAIQESERLRRAGLLKPITPKVNSPVYGDFFTEGGDAQAGEG